MNILIFAPHQDDEIIGCFHQIRKFKKFGYTVNVIFSSNGNYKGNKMASIRYYESIKALNLCGLESDYVHFMGYDDTGMHMEHSFLWNLYQMANPFTCLQTNNKLTWHPVSGLTLHKQYTGEEGGFSRENFEFDLKCSIMLFQPDLIIMPSSYDCHGDHKALSLFIKKILVKLQLNIECWCYLVHTPNEVLWPNRKGACYIKPSSIDLKLWDNRKTFFYSEENKILKQMAIKQFVSQAPFENDRFLFSFAKKEEFFLPS